MLRSSLVSRKYVYSIKSPTHWTFVTNARKCSRTFAEKHLWSILRQTNAWKQKSMREHLSSNFLWCIYWHCHERSQVFENHSQFFDIRTYLGVLTLWLWKGETLANLRKHLVQSMDLACFKGRETDRKQGYYKNIIRREWMDEKFYLSILASARESIENGMGSGVGKKNREKRHSSKRAR